MRIAPELAHLPPTEPWDPLAEAEETEPTRDTRSPAATPRTLSAPQPPRDPEARLTQREMDLAASVQKVTEEIVLRLTRNLAQTWRIKNLCLAGGVALNCVGNGKVLEPWVAGWGPIAVVASSGVLIAWRARSAVRG